MVPDNGRAGQAVPKDSLVSVTALVEGWSGD
jgi:hypothetical protein